MADTSYFVSEALGLVERAQAQGVYLRLLGSTAFRIHSAEYVSIHEAMDRPLTDIDFVAYSKQDRQIETFLIKENYTPVVAALTPELFAMRRIFNHSSNGIHIDVFPDELSMCHVIPFRNRLEVDSPTIPLAELVLEKTQIVTLNQKDIKDMLILLAAHSVGDHDQDTMSMKSSAQSTSKTSPATINMDYVIGCDLGSQGIKVILLLAEGRLAGEASVAYDIDYPYPTWAEQPVRRWTEAMCAAVKKLLQCTGVSASQVRAIALDAQVDGVVAIDSAGNPLRPAIIWMDRRAVDQCKAIANVCDPKGIFEITGLNLDASHVAPKILWLAVNEPDVFRRAAHFLLAGSYAAYFLTGEIAVDYSNASSTMLMDVHNRNWSGELCDSLGIPMERLAPILPSLTEIGTLRMEIPEKMGLNPSTRIILGSGDEHAACLGAGAVDPGLVCDIAGTAELVCVSTTRIIFDPTGLVETHCHADPELWLLENPGFASGANYRWFRDEFSAPEVQSASGSGKNPYELLNELAAEAPPGSDGMIFLPCLMGALAPTWNASARGTYFGFTLAHTRAHFVRALLEGSAYAVRDITDQMQNIGLSLEQIRVVGGGAQSRLWRQIKAVVTGLPIALPQTTETTALGAAMLAMVGIGLSRSLKQAASQAVKIIDMLEPDPRSKSRYEEYYQLYRSTYFALLPVFDQLAGIPGN